MTTPHPCHIFFSYFFEDRPPPYISEEKTWVGWTHAWVTVVSLAAVFGMSRNAPPKEKLRDIHKTAARETRVTGAGMTFVVVSCKQI